MSGCCGASDSEEESLLDTSSYRRSYREISSARRDNAPWRERSSMQQGDPQDQSALKNSVLDGVYAGLTVGIGLTPLDNPYSPQEAALKAAGIFLVHLPSSVYGAAISTLLNLNGNCTLFWTRDMPVFISTFISLVLQCGLTWHIAWMQFDESVELGSCRLGGRLFVRLSCVFVFTMYMVGELVELLDMHFWINAFRYANKHKALQIREYIHTGGYVVNKPVTGITDLERSLVYMLILIPRLLIAITLLVFGIPYISYAKRNEDLLLNTVGLLLVAELDEVVFKFSVPKMYRDTLAVPPLGRTDEEKARCFEMTVCGTLRSYVLFFLVAFVVTLSYLFWCQG